MSNSDEFNEEDQKPKWDDLAMNIGQGLCFIIGYYLVSKVVLNLAAKATGTDKDINFQWNIFKFIEK